MSTSQELTRGAQAQALKIDFYVVWNLYAKKVGNIKKLKSKWQRLSIQEQQQAVKHIPLYVQATPNKQYRKNFETYLNNKAWLDEIIANDNIDNSHADILHRLNDDSWAHGVDGYQSKALLAKYD